MRCAGSQHALGRRNGAGESAVSLRRHPILNAPRQALSGEMKLKISGIR